jgi:DNA polymerase-1
MGIPQLAVPGFEADDIMATVARLVSEQGGYCVLVTNDKDCRQLLSERVWLYDIRTGKTLDREGLLQEWGIRPEQVVDYQSLVGDAVDGVPGVPLIGPKTARELLQRYGTLENLYAHLDELPRSKRRENLQQFRDQALLSRQLVRLRDDVPLALDWHAMRLGRFRTEELAELCREFGFRQLAQRLFRLAGVTAPKDATAIQYRVVDTPEALDALVANLREAKLFTLDLETTDVRPRWAEIVGVAVAWQDEQGWYIPVRAPAGEAVLDENLVKERLRPLIEDPARGKVGQNVKYDAVVLRAAGLRPAGWAFDTMVADYLLSPGERNHSLDDLARRYLDYETIKISSLIGTGSKQRRMDTVPVSQVAPYAAADAVLPLRLMPILQQRLRHAELEPLFRNLEMPLVDVLVEMEFRGIRVDIGQLHALSQQFAERLRALEDEIYRLAGEPFNIDSPRQVARVMFERLKLPVQKQTRLSGPSTDINVLEALAPLHPLPALMVEYRQLSKLKNTYLDALPSMVHPQTGRIHSSFKQDVAATGRIISQDPNLQNIPVRTPEGRAIRAAFLPEPGWRFITADYSQIELRILAHYCQDTTLLEAFRREEDIHSRVAAEIFGVPLDQVTPEQRRRAKTVNFGIIYGQTPFGLANSLGIEQEEAAAFIEAYFARYPGVQHFIEETLQRCRREGYVSTLLGRRRWIQGIRPAERRQDRSRTLPERIAVNTVIQGSAADIIKLAMVRLHRCLSEQRLAAAMLLQIHDELVFETPPEEEPALRRLLQEQMTQVIPLRVPLRIDIHSGQNWAECD